jgi:Domain of unknown function (DUF4296)
MVLGSYKRFFAVVYLLYSFPFFYGCNNSSDTKVKKPEDLIKKETMVSILTDMHLLEGADALRLPVANKMYASQEKIFLKYGTNRESFKNSLNFYKNNLTDLQEIYDKVNEELTTIQTTISSRP